MSIKEFLNIAFSIFDRAVKLENESNYIESLQWYKEGLELLICIGKMPGCDKVVPELKRHTKDFMTKAEKLKDHIDMDNQLDSLKLNSGDHQQIKIDNGSIGHSYSSIFNKFLNKGDVREVIVEDPYIREDHQISNFVHFCEMLLKSESKVKRINLLTRTNRPASQDQLASLDFLKSNLRKHGVELIVTYSEVLHDRQIKFSNGWIVKIGRGLDYFQRLPNKAMVGVHDFDFRSCLETTVDIFHENSISKDNGE